MNTRRVVKALFVITLATLIGLGAYTFFYAKGYSYLTNDPKACMNCHVMRSFYTAWEVSSHRSVTCNGCHVPHDPIRKYLVKADNGFWHSFAFTFENVQVFRLKPRGRKVVEENCVRCHATTVSTVFHGGDGKSCFDCHRGVGHSA